MRPEVGSVVVYHNPVGKPLQALVTAVWSETCINVVFVSDDEKRQDDCGRQTERRTSVTHKSSPGTVHGNYWRFESEEPIAYTPPLAR